MRKTHSEEKDWKSSINEIIEEMTISQGELAELCQVSQQAVSRWTKGETKPGKFAQRKLLKLLEELSDSVRDQTHAYSIHSKADGIESFDGKKEQDTRENCLKELLEVTDALDISDFKEVINYAKYRLLAQK